MVNFETIPPRYRLVAKELFYGMLSGELPLGEFRPKLATVRRVAREIRVFLTWVDRGAGRAGATTGPLLSELTGQDLLAYQTHLAATVRHPGSRSNFRSGVRYLWGYRDALTTDRLGFDPRNLEDWSDLTASTPAENARDRIPEPVHGPMLAWALRFVDDFAADILAADTEWRRLRAPRSAEGRQPSAGEAAEKVRAQLADR